jgi:glutathione S-transferase
LCSEDSTAQALCCSDQSHRLNKSRGQRIIFLLEELGLDYEIKTYTRDKRRRAPAALKDVHPLGKSPTVSIEVPGIDKPLVLAESGPIVEYLCEHFGQHMIPKRYPEGKEGGVAAETEDWINYRVSAIVVLAFNPPLFSSRVLCDFCL